VTISQQEGEAATAASTQLTREVILACIALAGVILLALATRLVGLAQDSLWLDEIWSLNAAQMSLADMAEWTSGDIHPPLYYAILHFWIDMAGTSEAGMRSLSAALGVAVVVLLFLGGWRAGGLALGTAAAVLLSLNGAFLLITQEARMYALAAFLAIGTALLLARALEQRSILWFAAYALSGSALMYTHYVGFLAIAAFTVAWGLHAIMWRESAPKIVVLGGLATVAMALLYVPWLDDVLEQSTRKDAWDGHLPTLTLRLVLQTFRAAFGLHSAGSLWLGVMIPIVVLGSAYIWRSRRNSYVLCLVALGAVPILEVVASASYQQIFDLRRVSPFLPGIAFFIAAALAELSYQLQLLGGPPRLARGAVMAVFGVLLLPMAALDLQRGRENAPMERWRDVVADVERDAYTTYAYRPYIAEYLRYYLDEPVDIVGLNAPDVPTIVEGWVPIPRNDLQPVSLVIGRAGNGAPSAISEALASHFAVTGEHHFGGVTRFVLRPLSLSAYNVDVGEDWEAGVDGHIVTGFEPFIVHAGIIPDPESVRILVVEAKGPNQPEVTSLDDNARLRVLSVETLEQGWVRTTYEMPPIDSNTRYVLTPGLAVRALEQRRFTLSGAAILRDESQYGRQWFLRDDGYLGTVLNGPCIIPERPGIRATIIVQVASYGGWFEQNIERSSIGDVECLPELGAGQAIRLLSVTYWE
jgi:hypothetical protein